MSLYNMIFGECPISDVLLASLGLKRDDCGRYRDCFIDGDEIVIHTRNGGGNRDNYQEVFDKLARHPNYKSDEDDDFDCTYANINFSFPAEFAEDLKALSANMPSYKPGERWQELIRNLESQTNQKEQPCQPNQTSKS